MIVVSLDLDSQGRPIATLFASVSRALLKVMEANGDLAPRPVEVRAMVDTGASRCVVAASVLKSLELDPVGSARLATVSTGGTADDHNVFVINLFFAGINGATLDHDLQVVEVEDLSGLDIDMLLGRDLLERCLLVYTGPDRRFTLAFGPPPLEV